jgi:hypothetical protein
MKLRTLIMRALTVALLTFTAGSARADLVPWGYDWSAAPAGGVTAGTGKITLSNESFHVAVGDSQTVATNLQVFSTANPLVGQYDTFGLHDGGYTLTLFLKDLTSGKTGTLMFDGQLQGKFSEFNANVTNQFDPWTFRQSITLGDTKFTVTMNSYTPPGPPSQGNLGSIGALVEVKQVPEPSALGLFAFGGVIGLVAYRRRRKAA